MQVFGGRGITKTGMGRFVEHVSYLMTYHPTISTILLTVLLFFQYHRTIPFDARKFTLLVRLHILTAILNFIAQRSSRWR